MRNSTLTSAPDSAEGRAVEAALRSAEPGRAVAECATKSARRGPVRPGIGDVPSGCSGWTDAHGTFDPIGSAVARARHPCSPSATATARPCFFNEGRRVGQRIRPMAGRWKGGGVSASISSFIKSRAKCGLAGLSILFLVVAACVASPAAAAAAERRIALVVGNGSYRTYDRLANPPVDAQAIAKTLRGLDFDVDLALDLGHHEFLRRLGLFARRSESADVAVIYYAGHGVQVDGRNFLVPVDADATSRREVAYQAVDLDRVVEALAGSGIGIVFLDACRNAPSRSLGSGTRSVGRGLARVDSQLPGTLISFSTAPGEVAQDGPAGRASPYAQALLQHLATPGLEVHHMLTRVTGSVVQSTGGRQRPWVSASLDREFFFKPPVNVAPSPPTKPAPGPVAPSGGSSSGVDTTTVPPGIPGTSQRLRIEREVDGKRY
jgi:hypothetical protein